MKLKSSDTRMLEELNKIKVKCKCGHVQVMPAFLDNAICTHCGKKITNNTQAYFKYKLRKTLNK